MRAFNSFLLSFLFVFIVSCGGGEPEVDKTKETAVEQEKTFSFTWEAICRCPGESGSGQGKLCQSTGSYSGVHDDEEEAVEAMKAAARKELGCNEGPFISFFHDEA
jgi:hypothetical protein